VNTTNTTRIGLYTNDSLELTYLHGIYTVVWNDTHI